MSSSERWLAQHYHYELGPEDKMMVEHIFRKDENEPHGETVETIDRVANGIPAD